MAKRIRELRSPAARWRQQLTSVVSRPLSALSASQRFWIGFALLCLFTTVLIENPLWHASGRPAYREGDIARETVISPADIQYTDDGELSRRKELARASVKPIFRYESNKAEQAVQQFISAWEKLQRHGAQQPAPQAKQSNSDIKTETHWTGAGGAEVGRILASRDFSRNEIDAVQSAIRDAADGYIYDDSERQYFANEVVVFDRSKPNQQSNVSMPESNWTSLSAARAKLRTRLQSIKSLSAKEVDAFYTAAEILVEPSLRYDSVATEAARQQEADNVVPITVSLKRGQKIVGEGELITPQMMPRLAAVANYGSTTRQVNRFFGVLLMIGGLYWVAWKFVRNRGVVARLALSEQMTFALIGFVVLVQTAIMAALFRLAEFTAVQNLSAPGNDPSLWSFAIPFATASLLMTLLADRPIALFTGLFASLIAGFMAPRGFEFAIYSALSSAVAVYGIGRYRSRQTVTTAGVFVGVACSMLALAMLLYTRQPFILSTVLLSIACGLASGVLTAAFTSMLLPMCESAFGILTDVKLLELSNADLPVLGQLALRAPGTNQHSHAVGQLAEEACRVVGGNGLLARIGALYHDIGKTAAPEHFVENQINGKNPHDRLKPAQSAKIIIAHVNYGAKLAREMGLPQRIIDFIPQHHGTRTLHYFLKKAQAQARPDEVISENEFRYPGPKPQFKEAAIMMIADSCEAAARSLSEPTPENIRFIVTKIIDAILQDDQLDECDLTLRELTLIRESMIRSLVAIYHSRVDYPGYVPPNTGSFRITESGQFKTTDSGSLADAKPDTEGWAPADDRQKTAARRSAGGTSRYAKPSDIPVSPGGEIEDEAVDRTFEPADGKRAKGAVND
ncbi:MAG: HD family phosphohydrolase [Pyrinomonadaceae bacterium]